MAQHASLAIHPLHQSQLMHSQARCCTLCFTSFLQAEVQHCACIQTMRSQRDTLLHNSLLGEHAVVVDEQQYATTNLRL